MMKRLKVPYFKYKNDLGEVHLKNIEVFLDIDDYKKYKAGVDFEELDYGLSGSLIEKSERKIAVKFFKSKYQDILRGEYRISADELVAIQDFLGLNNIEFATVLGIDKSSYSNILKRGTMSHPVGLLAIERLGMDLSRPRSVKRLVDENVSVAEVRVEISKEIDEARYGKVS